jgi:N-acyl-D-amino-acid deacylase
MLVIRGEKLVGGTASRFRRVNRVFDANSIIDRARFAEPTLPAAGIEYVFVNGRSVWSGGKPTGERPGRALRRQLIQAAANS